MKATKEEIMKVVEVLESELREDTVQCATEKGVASCQDCDTLADCKLGHRISAIVAIKKYIANGGEEGFPSFPQEILVLSIREFCEKTNCCRVRVWNAFEKLGIHTVGDLVTKTRSDFLGLRNFGQTSWFELEKGLEQFGLSLRNE